MGLGGRQDAKDLIQEPGVAYPNGRAFNSRALKDYKVYGIPTTWFLTGDGKVFRACLPHPSPLPGFLGKGDGLSRKSDQDASCLRASSRADHASSAHLIRTGYLRTP